jgi:tetratricopeptide (TPR) repeat protein
MGVSARPRAPFGQLSILLLLLLLVLGPRPLAGYLDLQAAERALAVSDYAAAASRLASAAGRIPWRAAAWGQAGQAALLAGDFEDAVKWFGRGSRREALSQADWVAYGDALLALDDRAGADRAWQAGVDRFGPANDLVLRLARSERARGDPGQAVDRLQSLMEDDLPDGADVHLELGLLLAATTPGQALPHLVQAGQLDPGLEPGMRALRTALNTALLSDEPAYRLLLAGRALGSRGDWDLAALAFRNALAANYDYAEAWAWLGEAQQQLGQDAALSFQRAVVFGPDSPMVLGLYGTWLLRQGNTDAALVEFSEAESREPDQPVWQIALGGAWEQAGDLIQARAHYQRAVELAPQDPAAWQALAVFSLTYQIEPVELGLVAARRLLLLTPSDWFAYDLAGQLMLDSGDPAGAEAMLKQALELDPSRAEVYLHLALLYLQGPQPENAYAYLVNARTFDPQGPAGWQAGRLLEQYFP